MLNWAITTDMLTSHSKKDVPAVAGDPVHWNNNVWLREEQYPYAYFTNVANGEKMKLRVEGRWE